jgi:hypothetical protein
MKTRIVLTGVVSVVCGASVHADELPLRQMVVNSAMSVQEFTTRCGQPTSRTSHTEDVKVRNRNTGLMEKVGETTLET